jgi:AcrR family transcriptional regulator
MQQLKKKHGTASSSKKSRGENTARHSSAIIKAALDEFTENGFVAARMEDIAGRAGVGKGTIYLHFKDKEALFEAIIRQQIIPLVGAAASGPSPDETVRAFLERVIVPQFHDLHRSQRGAAIRLLIAEAGRFPKLADLYFRMVVEPGLAVFSNLARRAVKTGELEGTALVRFPHLFVAPVVIGLLWSGLFERHRHLDVEEMLRAFFDQLFVRPALRVRSIPRKPRRRRPA